MDRSTMLDALENMQGYWDVIVVGGGASGLGVAVESAARGCQTLLLEQHESASLTAETPPPFPAIIM